VDSEGDTYVASYGGTIRIFNPTGGLITTTEAVTEPCGLAVDSAGNLYVDSWHGKVTKLNPSGGEFPPTGSTTYTPDSSVNGTGVLAEGTNFAVAVDPANDNVYVGQTGHITEFEPNGTVVSSTIGEGVAGAEYYGVDVDGQTGDVYALDFPHGKVYVFAASNLSGAPKTTIDGSTSEAGAFGFGSFGAQLAVEQSNGHVYVFDVEHLVVDEFEASGAYVTQLSHAFEDGAPSDVAVAPPGSPTAGDVFVADLHKLDAFGPLPAPAHPYLAALSQSNIGEACGAAVDSEGDTYVASYGGTIRIFNPTGGLITTTEAVTEPCGLAVDSAGNLYVDSWHGKVTKLNPSGGEFPPTGSTTYTPDSSVNGTGVLAEGTNFAVAVDPANDNVYVGQTGHITEFEPNGTVVSSTIGEGVAGAEYYGVDVDGQTGDVYALDFPHGKVYVFAASNLSGAPKTTIDGSTSEAGAFGFGSFGAQLAVEQSNGHVYVFDVEHLVVDEFEASGAYVTQLSHAFEDGAPSDVAVAPPGSPTAGDVFVADLHKLDAFGPLTYELPPPPPAPPAVSDVGASQITASTATLHASINPENQATSYRFEYGLADCAANPCTRVPAVDAEIGSGSVDLAVAREVTGLQPATTYHFRVVASNATGAAESSDLTFTTYPPSAPGLPDGRAYELVSLPDTNGFPPFGSAMGEIDNGFAAPLAAEDGASVVYAINGSLPGSEGNGWLDQYRAVRTSNGWTSELTSPSGAQSSVPSAGGVSPDHHYAFWSTGGFNNVTSDTGSLELGNSDGTRYVRGPDGNYELIGQGSMGTDLGAKGRLMTPGAGHIIFTASNQLEPNAPEAPGSGTDPTNFGQRAVGAVYDRTPGGPTHVVSLLPGNETAPPGSNTFYEGASADGSAVVFLVDTTMYERRDNTATTEVATGGPKFAGISRSGDRVFYLKGGNIFVFDASTETTTPIGSGGESTVVNVSADGSHVYFVSPQQLDGGNGSVGADNLYVWDGGTVRFIADLAPSDLQKFDQNGLLSLAEWTNAVGPVRNALTGPGRDPSRTTPDGEVFVFQSHASLTSYDSAGHSEVYRYDAGDQSLLCVSCSPIGAPAGSDAQLVLSALLDAKSPTGALSLIPNVTDDGEAVFFQSADALDPRDSNSTWDVYEWKSSGISLISSGHSSFPSYLYGMTPDGHDVFFTTREKLVPRDHTGSAGAIYDARVGGGFQEAAATGACVEDTCQGPPGSGPNLPSAGSAGIQGPGNLTPHRHRKARHCGKGKRRVKRNGKARCVKRGPRRASRGGGGAK
jgi:hypothetical protein